MISKTISVRSILEFRLGTLPLGRACAAGLPLSLGLALGASGCGSSVSPDGKDADGPGPSAKELPESGKDEGEGSNGSQEPSEKESPSEESPKEDASKKDETPGEESSEGSSSKEQEPSEESSPDEEEPSGEESPEKEEPSSEETPEKDDPSEEKTPEEEEPSEKDQDPNGRDCSKIDWGSDSEIASVGKIVGRSDSVGYLDRNKNGRIDDDELEETQVGLCQLHLTGKKCGYVIYGDTG